MDMHKDDYLNLNSAILNPTNSANGLSFKRLVSILNVSHGDGDIVHAYFIRKYCKKLSPHSNSEINHKLII